ncbi:MAG: hypothetical protein AB7U41_03100 [Dongiaceae bacterium]
MERAERHRNRIYGEDAYHLAQISFLLLQLEEKDLAKQVLTEALAVAVRQYQSGRPSSSYREKPPEAISRCPNFFDHPVFIGPRLLFYYEHQYGPPYPEAALNLIRCIARSLKEGLPIYCYPSSSPQLDANVKSTIKTGKFVYFLSKIFSIEKYIVRARQQKKGPFFDIPASGWPDSGDFRVYLELEVYSLKSSIQMMVPFLKHLGKEGDKLLAEILYNAGDKENYERVRQGGSMPELGKLALVKSFKTESHYPVGFWERRRHLTHER